MTPHQASTEVALATTGAPAQRGLRAVAAAGPLLCRAPTAAEVMHRRPPVADQHTSLWTAWTRLRGPEHRHLVVVDHRSHPVAVFDERDLALAWPPGPQAAQRVPLRRLLSGGPPPRVRGSDDLATVAQAMLAAHADAVAVVDGDGQLVGLVTARHCVELLAGHRLA